MKKIKIKMQGIGTGAGQIATVIHPDEKEDDPEAWRVHKCYVCGARYTLLKTSRGDICTKCAEKMVAEDLLKLGVNLNAIHK